MRAKKRSLRLPRAIRFVVFAGEVLLAVVCVHVQAPKQIVGLDFVTDSVLFLHTRKLLAMALDHPCTDAHTQRTNLNVSLDGIDKHDDEIGTPRDSDDLSPATLA